MLLVALINANDGMKVTMREYEKKTNRDIQA